MKRNVLIILTIGLILRVFLAASTYHADVAALGFAGKVVSEGNVLNLYDYLSGLPAGHPYLNIYPTNLFIYPPPIYFLYGGLFSLIRGVFGADFINIFIANPLSLFGEVKLSFFLLFLKLPLFVFDIATAFLLMILAKDEKFKTKLFAFWIFNPVTLYATYMMGQFDIIPVFFTAASLCFAVKKKKIYLSSLMLGLGMSFKIYPLLFLVPLAFTKNRWIDRVKVAVTGVLPYLFCTLPFIGSKGFRTSALLAGQTTKSMYAVLPISGGESIIIYIAAVLFIYIVFLYSTNPIDQLWLKYFLLMLLFFIFTHYHPQWFLWITPFLILDLVESRLKSFPLILLSLLSWIGLVTFFDPGLSTRLFAPIIPSLGNLPGIWQILGLDININLARSYFQTIFAAVGFYYLYKYFPKEVT